MTEKLHRPCQRCGSREGYCGHEANAKSLLGILQVFGSKGMPSCGQTDAALSQGTDSRTTIGGTDEEIAPGTDLSDMPLSVIYAIAPWLLPKNSRNRRRQKK